jgi:hypothetical protein
MAFAEAVRVATGSLWAHKMRIMVDALRYE